MPCFLHDLYEIPEIMNMCRMTDINKYAHELL